MLSSMNVLFCILILTIFVVLLVSTTRSLSYKDQYIYISGRGNEITFYSNNSNKVEILSSDDLDYSDSFVAKYSLDGEIKWVAKQSSDSGVTPLLGTLTTDGLKNIYFSCNFYDSIVDIYDSKGRKVKILNSDTDINIISSAIINYSSSGEVLWSTLVKGSGINGVFSDKNEGIYTTGYFPGETTTFYSSSDKSKSVTLNSIDGSDSINSGFLVKYDNNGNTIWGISFQSSIAYSLLENTVEVTVSSTNDIYFVGTFDGGILTFNSTNGKQKQIETDSRATYIAKYTSDGVIVWVTYLSSLNRSEIKSLKEDYNGDLYFAGNYSGSSLAINSVSGKKSKPLYSLSKIYSNGFLLKYNSEGEYIWGLNVNSMTSVACRGLTIDNLNNIYITGGFVGDFKIHGISGSNSMKLLVSDTYSSYLAKFTPEGKVLWAVKQDSSSDDESYRLESDNKGRIYLTGIFTNDITLYSEKSFKKNIILTTSDSSVEPNQSVNDYHDSFLASYSSDGDVLWATTQKSKAGEDKILGLVIM